METVVLYVIYGDIHAFHDKRYPTDEEKIRNLKLHNFFDV